MIDTVAREHAAVVARETDAATSPEQPAATVAADHARAEPVHGSAHGRCTALRWMRSDHRTQRHVLQVHELRQLDGVQLTPR